MKEGMLHCIKVSVTVASTLGSHTRLSLLRRLREAQNTHSKVFTVPPEFLPWMRLSQIKPGAGNSNCTAFGDVLGILLLVFPRVPSAGSAWLCSALQKTLWKEILGGRRRKPKASRSPWKPGFQGSRWNLMFGVSFPVFLGLLSEIRIVTLVHTSEIL